MATEKGQGKQLLEGVMQKLPQDIVADILAKLPVKSLLRFRCACKPWRTLIATPHFVKMHLSQKNKHQRVAILSNDGIDDDRHLRCVPCKDLTDSLYSLDFEKAYDDGNHVEALKSDIPIKPDNYFWGSCNGLLLLVDEPYTLLLVNPSTREYKRIEIATCHLADYEESYGIGYDSSIDDYKVVSLFYDDDNVHHTCETIVNVYTLRSNSWRRIQDSPYDHYFGEPGPVGIFVNGALHWLVCHFNGSPVIASLNLVDEKFRDVPLPRLSKSDLLYYKLGDIGGCLCLFDTNVIWLMKEYGVASSWTKYTLSVSKMWVKPLFFTRNDEILLFVDETKLVFYNKIARTCQDLVISNITNGFDVETYIESLVSLNCSNHEIDQVPKKRRMNNRKAAQT